MEPEINLTVNLFADRGAPSTISHFETGNPRNSLLDKANINLLLALKSYGVDSDLAVSWKNEVSSMFQFLNMNGKVLAAALIILNNTRGIINPQLFNRHINDVLGNLLTKKGISLKNSTEEQKIIIQKHKEGVLRYIFAIINFRTNK